MQNDEEKETPFVYDPYSPKQIALHVEQTGIKKAKLESIPTLLLAILAGAFIAIGGAFYTIVITESGMGIGPTRLLGGIAFSTGLILVVVGGAELFTGNNLIVIAWVDKKVTSLQLLRNWGIVYIGNIIGSLFIAALIAGSGILYNEDGKFAQTAIRISEHKLALLPLEAFIRGILCNMLVCLALWLCFAARSVVGKVFAIIFPISAFVALGFEHSVANMYLIPVAWFLEPMTINLIGLLSNLAMVTLGNIVGGGGFVAFIYWSIYIRKTEKN